MANVMANNRMILFALPRGEIGHGFSKAGDLFGATAAVGHNDNDADDGVITPSPSGGWGCLRRWRAPISLVVIILLSSVDDVKTKEDAVGLVRRIRHSVTSAIINHTCCGSSISVIFDRRDAS